MGVRERSLIVMAKDKPEKGITKQDFYVALQKACRRKPKREKGTAKT